MRKQIFALLTLLSVLAVCFNIPISCESLPIEEEEGNKPDLPGSIVAGDNGSLTFELSLDGNSEGTDYILVQESVYVDPDGTSHKLSPKAKINIVTMVDTLATKDLSHLVPSEMSSEEFESSFDEEANIYKVRQQFNVGSQKIIVTMTSEEPVLENSLGQTVKLPFLKLADASLDNVEATVIGPSTCAIEITDTTYYKVKASYVITAELCNVEEQKTENLECSVDYVGLVTDTQLYPGQNFSYVLTDAEGNAVDYSAVYDILPGADFVLNIEQLASYKDNKKDVQENLRAWTSISVADTLDVMNLTDFLAQVESAVTIDSGYEASSAGLPYWELHDLVFDGYSIVDSLDVYPSASMRVASFSSRQNRYSQRIVVVEPDEVEQASPKAQVKSVENDLNMIYPRAKDLICPERIYTAELMYSQTAVLRNSDEEKWVEFHYKANVVAKARVELVDVEYDANGVAGIFPTYSGEKLFNQTIVERYRIYSTGERLTDHFESNKTMLFALSLVAVYYQENFDWKYTSWEEADTLDPHIPTIMQVPYDDVPWYDFYSYPSEAEVHRQYHWSVGMDWDILRNTGLGEVNSAVGIPGIHRFDGVDLGEWFGNHEIEKFGKGQYETYLHSDTRENYDSSVNTPGWYTGYLQSRHFCYGEIYFEDDVDPRSCMHSIWVPRMKIDLCINEKVLCIDDRIFAPKQLLDDKVVEKTVEDAVSPTRGPVKIAKMGLDFTVYDEVFKFRLTDTLYNYYSPHYEWENSGN